VLAAAAGKAVATCPTTMYISASGQTDGSNMMNNLIVAAVVGVHNSYDTGNSVYPTTPVPLSATVLKSGLITTGATNLDGSSVPVLNTQLGALLDASATGCGKCVMTFYEAVYKIVGNNANAGASQAFICGLWTTTPTSTSVPYDAWGASGTVAEGLVWGNSIATNINNSATCISYIQPAIDAFNICAGNGFDIKTGKLNEMCTPESLLTLDGTYGLYETMMSKALVGTALPAAFAADYSNLPCRSCVDTFISSVATLNSASALYDATNLAEAKCSEAAAGHKADFFKTTANTDCLGASGPILPKLDTFQVCAGTTYMINKKKTIHANANEKILMNALKPYEAIVRCSNANSINAAAPTADARAAWETCLEGYSPMFTYDTDYTISAVSTNLGRCIHSLGGATTAASVACSAVSDIFSTAAGKCIDTLNTTVSAISTVPYGSDTTSGLIQFFQCSGVNLTRTTTVCTATEIAAISSIHKSYVPVIEIAMGAAGTGDAGAAAAVTAIMADTDLWAGVGDVPCRSCYAKLAAELKHEMTTDDKNLCSNPYSTDCKSTRVAAALARFKTCSGFDLTSAAANTCTSAEWDIMRNAKLQANTFNLLLPSVSATLTQAQFHLAELMTTLKAANPTKTFRCDHCYEVLVNDLYSLSLANKQICQANIGSGACFAVASSAFTKFATCSGFTFDFSAVTTTTTTTTTLAPGSTESTTSDAPVDPETTKAASTSQFASVVMASIVAIMAL
jgi:hypothetical protein